MKHLRRLLLIACVAFFPGCAVQSLHPLYTKDDLVYEPGLIGRWMDPQDDDQSWTFTKPEDEDNVYEVIVKEDGGRSGRFRGLLLKLEDTLYLDLLPNLDDDDEGVDMRGFALFPVHLILKVRSIEPKLQMDVMSLKWLDELLEKEPGMLKHERVGFDGDPESSDKQLLVTAPTGELQAFVIKHSHDPDAWIEWTALVRTPPSR